MEVTHCGMAMRSFPVEDRGAVATSHDGARLRSLTFENRGKQCGGMEFSRRVSGCWPHVRGIATGSIGRYLSRL